MPESRASDETTDEDHHTGELPGAPRSGALPPPNVVTEDVRLVEPPRAGQLSTGWRVVTAALWLSVIVAFAAVWNTSVQLGLSTWWLGPRADPQWPIIRLSPFVAPLIVAIAAFNNLRHLAWVGMGAALITAFYGVGDLGRVTQLAVLELVIAGLAFAVSAASLTGTYRASDTIR